MEKYAIQCPHLSETELGSFRIISEEKNSWMSINISREISLLAWLHENKRSEVEISTQAKIVFTKYQ
jgi:hypothetical protein